MAPERPPTLRASTTPERLIDLAGHLPGGGGLDLDAAAVGGEPAAVADERAVVAVVVGRHGHLQEAVAGEVERRLLAGAEADLAHAGGDRAGVVDLAADQRRVAARGRPRSSPG